MAAVVVYPLVWVVGASFGPDKGLANASAIPAGATLDNYRELLTGTDYPRWYLNSLIVATANAVLSVVLSAFNAYVFSRLRFRGRSAGLLVMLVLQVFPSFLTAIAVYMLFLNLGLLDSLVGLVVVSVAAQLPYNTWLLKGYMDNISTSFDEAALMDGASRLQVFRIIILPLTKPMLTFVAITQFAVPWMDFVPSCSSPAQRRRRSPSACSPWSTTPPTTTSLSLPPAPSSSRSLLRSSTLCSSATSSPGSPSAGRKDDTREQHFP